MYNCAYSRRVLVRAGFADYDDFGFGLLFAAYGCLDAPDYMPQGSVRIHNTLKPRPTLSIAHRDWCDVLPIGAPHDGAEPATMWLSK